MEPHTAPPLHDLTIFALHCKLYTSNLEDIAQEWDFFLKILETLLEAEKQRYIYIKTRIKNVSSKVAVILFSFWC